MGSNGGWDSYDELIAQYQAMIEKSGTQCYIIIGDTDNPTEAYDSEQYESDIEVGTKDNVWETALREAFGEHFINMRAFMIEHGLETVGIRADRTGFGRPGKRQGAGAVKGRLYTF